MMTCLQSICHCCAAALALELLVWFKRDFFSWVDNAPCERCGCKATKADKMVGPNPGEAEHGAAHIELYRCPQVRPLRDGWPELGLHLGKQTLVWVQQAWLQAPGSP